ncbi:hypothetical protein B0H14DRAFT_352980 [Mycena olivaceomarginata]|nr:hypothetical protein B0H14DRAFT_352980 [Mycena olivaceomarginata]
MAWWASPSYCRFFTSSLALELELAGPLRHTQLEIASVLLHGIDPPSDSPGEAAPRKKGQDLMSSDTISESGAGPLDIRRRTRVVVRVDRGIAGAGTSQQRRLTGPEFYESARRVEAPHYEWSDIMASALRPVHDCHQGEVRMPLEVANEEDAL